MMIKGGDREEIEWYGTKFHYWWSGGLEATISDGEREMTEKVEDSPINDDQKKQKFFIFTYGTLKRGFPNHGLMQGIISSGDATFLGEYRTLNKFPLVQGPHGVPFLLNLPQFGLHQVHGELYSVSERGLVPLEELEGITRGHYERLPIQLLRVDGDPTAAAVDAEAYFAHRKFAEDMWRRSGEVGFAVYSDKLANEYVPRDLRSKERTFLEEILLFVSSSPSPSPSPSPSL